MCIILANLSYKQSDLTPSEKHILLILCHRADPNTYKCWPCIKSLMNDSGYSRPTLKRTLLSLRDKKLIIDTKERKGTTKQIIVYKMNLINEGYHDDTLITGKGIIDDRERVSNDTNKGYHHDTRKDHNNVERNRKENLFPLKTKNPCYSGADLIANCLKTLKS